jgi:hypothetical protein
VNGAAIGAMSSPATSPMGTTTNAIIVPRPDPAFPQPPAP